MELKSLSEEYPYCSVLEVLLAKGYHNQENVEFENQLKKTAISVSNRNILYDFIRKENTVNEADKVEEEITLEVEKPIEKLEEDNSQLPEKEISLSKNLEQVVSEKKEILKDEESQELEKLILNSAMSAVPLLEEEKVSIEEEEISVEEKTLETNDSPQSFYDWLSPNSPQSTETKKNSENKPSIEEMVDKFIAERKNDSSHIRIDKDREIVDFYSPIKVANESLIEKDDFVTETLAKIYLNQGLTDKAIRIYERLSLKNPEKSSYFADLIQKIRQNEL